MNSKPKKQTGGCLWIFMFFLYTGILFGLILVILNLSFWLAAVIAGSISIVLSYVSFGKPRTDGLIITLSVMIACLAFIGVGFTILLNLLAPHPSTAHFVGDEAVVKTKILDQEDSIVVYRSNRVWRDNLGNEYSGYLTVRDEDYKALKDYLKNYNAPSPVNFWGNLYDHIERTDRSGIDLVIAAFEDIQQERKLNRMEFAEMIVSCIQDIPYSFVFQDDCLPAQQYEYSIRSILEDCPECCIGNVSFGIQNPVSFLQNLKGDCDTRTVLIYSLLKHFNYDVAILNSDYYKHSILGINLPASGYSKTYNGKRYVLWETTAKYYEVGSLPAAYDDLTYWNVVLTSK